MAKKKPAPSLPFPQKGTDAASIKEQLANAAANDKNWRRGRTFSLVFYPGDEVSEVSKQAYLAFSYENGLNVSAFPSLRKFETEVVAMSIALMNGDADVVGNMTSGGTESILCAVKTAKNKWAKENADTIPEVIVPQSAHPAFDKACDYFGLKLVHVPVDKQTLRADVAAMEKAITPNTVMIVGSAPSYPHGLIDPIEDLAKVAQKHHLLFHVDACVGGYALPFVERLGYPVPKFDFRVPGVTSISMDLHKYGYATKGASVVLYKNSVLRKNQYFLYTEWTGGIYISPTVTGTRPGGPIAAAWAVLNFLGEEGYLRINKAVMEATEKIIAGINAIEGLYVIGKPEMSVLGFTSDKYDIFRIGDEMNLKGWHIDKQQNPDSLHLTISYGNVQAVDDFLTDLKEAVKQAKKLTLDKIGGKVAVGLVKGASKVLPEKQMSKLTQAVAKMGGTGVPKRSAAMYGVMGAISNEGDLNEILLNLMDGLNKMEQ
ncbi:MAG: aspartate aminotransferase family protein [Chitinophagales bacterium]|nr:aspartate aminotransferase family protein [Chitinophagales bacterium]